MGRARHPHRARAARTLPRPADRPLLRPRRPRRAPIKVSTWSVSRPARPPRIPSEIRERLVDEHLLNPRRYHARFGVPSVSMEEPSFRPGFNAYRTWRGAAWMNTTWLLTHGLVPRRPRRGRTSSRRRHTTPSSAAASASTTTRAPAAATASTASASPRCYSIFAALGSASSVKLLVVTPEPIDAAALRKTLGDEVNGAEVLVLSPATNQSKLAFWVCDPDDAIAEAEHAEDRDRREPARRRRATRPATWENPSRHRPSTTRWRRSPPTAS